MILFNILENGIRKSNHSMDDKDKKRRKGDEENEENVPNAKRLKSLSDEVSYINKYTSLVSKLSYIMVTWT